MLKKRELLFVILGVIIMTLVLILNPLLNKQMITIHIWLNSLIISIIIIFLSVFIKKITAKKLDTKIEMSIWAFKRYGVHVHQELKKSIPFGILLPLVLSIFTMGILKFLAFFQFRAEALPAKVAKKYGARRYSSVMEWDYALICFYSLLSVLILALISSYLSYSFFPFKELGKIAIYFVISNIIPFGQLDGMKIFMGSKPLYLFSLILVILTSLIVLI